ncbi:MAG TPA: peptidoglycan DD-metalloendopeptidase family protein [Rudaea sp.]
MRKIVALALGLAAASAGAKHIYQYTDAQGVVHFTDVKPADAAANGDVKSTLVHTDAQPLIRMREDGTDLDRTLVFVNSAGGPVSIRVEFEQAENVRSEPPLPALIVAPAVSELRAVRILATDPRHGYRYRFRYTYMPGDYRARHDDTARYHLPFPADRRFRVSQAFNGAFSHNEAQNRYAVDITMPEGTPVLAARDGVVMTVDNDYYGAGLDMTKYGDRANNVRIVHSDGTMAVYAHLQLESARVQVGDRVHAGQVIALSGDTGYTSGPHLHFCVQANSNMNLVSVPFEFADANGGFVPTAGMMLP